MMISETFVVEVPELATADDVLPRLAEIAAAHDILRIKGFLAIAGKPMRLLVQGVGARFSRSFERAWGPGEARRSRLVVIGQTGLDRAAIAEAFEAVGRNMQAAAAH